MVRKQRPALWIPGVLWLCAGALQAQSLAITPSAYPAVTVGGTLQFAAVPSGFAISSIKWLVGTQQGGTAATGTITTGLNGGLYTAPTVIPGQNPQTIGAVVTATSGSKYSATVYVTVLPQASVITSVSPNPLPPGTTTVKVNGSGFTANSLIWDSGVQYGTQMSSPNTLTATVYTGAGMASATFTVVTAGAVSNAITVPVGTGASPPTYTLTVLNGTGSGTYAAGTAVNIAANAAQAGQQFQSWTGAGVANAGSAATVLTMPAGNTTVTANYSAIPTYSLTVVNGTGGGTYPAGTAVNITASAAPGGQQFQSWTGAAVANSTAAGTTITMPAANTTVTATYAAVPTYSLTVVNGTGSGSYPAGTTVNITASAAPAGQQFQSWTGAAVANSTAAGTTITMPAANTIVTATYAAVPTYSLNVVNGTGSGSYTPGTIINITANAAPQGMAFSSWSGAAVGLATSATTTLAMPAANTTVSANYSTPPAGQYTVTYSNGSAVAGFGPTDPNQYSPGQSVTVAGNIGYLFSPGQVLTGWNTAQDGSGMNYNFGATLTMGTANVHLYPQWNTRNTPVSVWGGARAAVALKADGSVWTWGMNTYGQRGDGTTVDNPVPGQVQGPGGTGYLTGVTAIMGGEEHNVALKSDGSVWAWGMNSFNQLGNGTNISSSTPVQVSGLSGIVALGGRAYHTLAIKSDGTVWAWGLDKWGALGNGVADASPDYPVPVQVQGLSHPIMVSGGYLFGLALLADHTVVAWGANTNGQLGDGTNTPHYTPAPVLGLDHVISISAGWKHAMAVKSDGTVWTWGINTWTGIYPGSGLLGDGTTLDRAVPTQVPGLTGAIQVSAGDSFSSVLLRDGTVWTFGSNGAGQLGTGSLALTQSLVPVQVQGLNNIVSITARDQHSQAIRSDGTVWSWGSGQNGELGNGTSQNSPSPVQVTWPN